VKRVGLLITGNEVLFGKTRDTNGPHMAAALRKVGCEVRRSLVCGDDVEEILRALDYLFENCDVVLMTGGLGPTSDDLTAEIIARRFRLPLAFNDEAWAACVDAFARMGRSAVPETNRKQANLPVGCRLLPNPNGTAVGFSVSGELGDGQVSGQKTVYCLPGVPFEMEPMFAASVLPNLTPSGAVTFQRTWQVFGLGESAMQERVGELERTLQNDLPGIVVSYQAHAGYVTYGCFFSAPHSAAAVAAETLVDGAYAQGVEKAFGRHIVGRSELSLAASTISAFTEAGVTLAVAESCTGGALSKELTAIPRSSLCYLGGITTYANSWKEQFLGVSAETLQNRGAVSEATAAEMASGLLLRVNADVVLSITGVAGPGGGSDRTPVGTVCFGLAVRSARVDVQGLVSRLEGFKWGAPQEAPEAVGVCVSEGVTLLTTTVRFGSRLRRDVIQMRACVQALGTLAMVAESLSMEQR
jgi:nicotinamide-nucleotide amidase